MKKVLIVDDAMFIRKSLQLMLQRNGYEVVGEAENGTVAVKKFSELNPDIVTMDITMPEADGISALKSIMSMDRAAKVVIISALGQESQVREAILAGAKGFIVKPFQEETVLKALSAL